MFTNRNIRINAGRTKEEQRYRKTLYESLRRLRATGTETSLNLAKNLLESEQKTDRYKTSIGLKRINENNIDYMITHGNIKFLVNNLDKIKGFSHKEIADKIIENGKGGWVAAYLYKFEGLDHNEIISKLINVGKKGVVYNYFYNFKQLNKETAMKLIEVGYEELVLYNLNKFSGLERLDYKNNSIKRLVRKCSEYEGFPGLLDELNRIDGLDLEAVGGLFSYMNYLEDDLWERKHGHASKSSGLWDLDLDRDIENISDTIRYKKLPGKIIKGIMDNFENFDNASRVGFAKLLYKYGFLQKYLDKFSLSEQKTIALDLINDGKGDFVIKYIDKFHGLDEEVAKRLNEKGYGKYVSKYLKNFGLTK